MGGTMAPTQVSRRHLMVVIARQSP